MNMLLTVEPRHFDEIDAWYEARKIKTIDRDLLPKLGLMVPGIAAGFLIQTDAHLGILEHFITNPVALGFKRRSAIESIARTLMGLGRTMGMRGFLAITDHPLIEDLARLQGLQELTGLRVFGRGE